MSLSLKDFKQGVDVSRFAMEHAASGSRWSGESQTGGRKGSQKTGGGSTQGVMRTSLQRMPANKIGELAKITICHPNSGKDCDYQQMLGDSCGLKASLHKLLRRGNCTFATKDLLVITLT